VRCENLILLVVRFRGAYSQREHFSDAARSDPKCMKLICPKKSANLFQEKHVDLVQLIAKERVELCVGCEWRCVTV
jgi:hypothetical protein